MVHILQIPGLIVAAELCSQLCPVFAVSVADHEELVTEIDLVHIFQVGLLPNPNPNQTCALVRVRVR